MKEKKEKWKEGTEVERETEGGHGREKEGGNLVSEISTAIFPP